MKILEINSVCGIRSTGRICTDLADVLSAAGHECMIAYGREEVPSGYQKIALSIGGKANVMWHGWMSRIFGKSGFYSRWATRKLLKKVDEDRPDVIHLHNLHGYYLHIGLLFAYIKKHNIPVVWTLHDCWPFTGHCAHFTRVGCDQWKTGCKTCPQVRAYPSCWLWDNVKRNYEMKCQLTTGISNMVLVTPSQWLAGLVKQSFLKDYPVEVISNGIDLNVFHPTDGSFRKKYQLENKHIVLGVASAWSRSKGLYDFIEMASRLPENYQVVLVGLTARQIREMPANVLCIERTNSARELAEIYSAADVFVNPSRQETMGLVTVEALACGTPCVVYNATAVPECVDDTCGSIVKVEDLDGLCAEICRVVQEKPYRAEACVLQAEKYEKVQQFDRYVELYGKLCEKQAKTGRE